MSHFQSEISTLIWTYTIQGNPHKMRLLETIVQNVFFMKLFCTL